MKNGEFVRLESFLPQYRQITELQREINDIQQEYNTRINGYIDIKTIENDAVLYTVPMGKVAILSMVLFFFNPIMLLSLLIPKFDISGLPKIIQFTVIMLAVAIALVFPVVISWLIVSGKVRKQKRAAQEIYDKRVANANKINQKLDELCSCLLSEIRKKTEELCTLTSKIEKNNESPVPKQYWYAADSLYELMDSGRADTIKEAINLFEDICHKQRLENLTAQNAPSYDDHWMEQQLLNEQVAATREVERQLDRMRLF